MRRKLNGTDFCRLCRQVFTTDEEMFVARDNCFYLCLTCCRKEIEETNSLPQTFKSRLYNGNLTRRQISLNCDCARCKEEIRQSSQMFVAAEGAYYLCLNCCRKEIEETNSLPRTFQSRHHQ
jgi:hypothetical protein